MENICNIKDNVNFVFESVNDACAKCGRNFNDIQIMGVSKTKTAEEVQKAIDAGITLFGENKVQEMLLKQQVFAQDNVSCHMIGQLQTNKVKYLPNITKFIQSVDSLKLAKEIDKQYTKANQIANVLIEINIGNEEGKGGIEKEGIETFLGEIVDLKSIKVKGFMCVPPICEGETVRRYFAQMHNIFVDFSAKIADNVNISVLSMGMSNDYQYAILEGSNLVRIGQGIFGTRNYNKA